MTLADWGNYLTVLQVGIVVYKQWITAAGHLKLIYWLMIVAGALGVVSNTLLAMAAPEVWGILSTLVIMVWSILMGIKGILRLSEDDAQLRMFTEVMEKIDGSDTRILKDIWDQGLPVAQHGDNGGIVLVYPDGTKEQLKG